MRAGEISKKELGLASLKEFYLDPIAGPIDWGRWSFRTLRPMLLRIFERGVRVYRDLDDMETALGLNNASAL